MCAVCKSCGDNGIAIRENTVVSRFFRTLKRLLRPGPGRIKVLDAAQLRLRHISRRPRAVRRLCSEIQVGLESGTYDSGLSAG